MDISGKIVTTKFKIFHHVLEESGSLKNAKSAFCIGTKFHSVKIVSAKCLIRGDMKSKFGIFHYSRNNQGEFGNVDKRDTYVGLKGFCVQVRKSSPLKEGRERPEGSILKNRNSRIYVGGDVAENSAKNQADTREKNKKGDRTPHVNFTKIDDMTSEKIERETSRESEENAKKTKIKFAERVDVLEFGENITDENRIYNEKIVEKDTRKSMLPKGKISNVPDLKNFFDNKSIYRKIRNIEHNIGDNVSKSKLAKVEKKFQNEIFIMKSYCEAYEEKPDEKIKSALRQIRCTLSDAAKRASNEEMKYLKQILMPYALKLGVEDYLLGELETPEFTQEELAQGDKTYTPETHVKSDAD